MTILHTYIILDAARCGMDAIGQAQALCKDRQDSLYLVNEDSRHLQDVAPYLFSSEDGLKEWYRENGWGQAWGIKFVSNEGFDKCRRHFRKFLLVRTPNRKELYFRFYDPRVLKTFLPTCDIKQMLEFFGPVRHFIVEGETKDDGIRFWHENGLLKQQKLATDELFGEKVI